RAEPSLPPRRTVFGRLLQGLVLLQEETDELRYLIEDRVVEYVRELGIDHERQAALAAGLSHQGKLGRDRVRRAVFPNFVHDQAFVTGDALAHGEAPFAEKRQGLIDAAGEDPVRIENEPAVAQRQGQLVSVPRRLQAQSL